MTNPDPPASSLLERVLELCLLRRGPQDLPYSPALLAGLLVAGTAVDVVAGAMRGSIEGGLGRSLLSSAVVLGLCWVALAIRRLRSRFVQAAIGLLASSLAFSIVLLPLAALSGPAPARPEDMTPSQLLIGWFVLGLFVWQVAVAAHVMRHALDAPFAFALLLVSTWMVAYFALERVLFV